MGEKLGKGLKIGEKHRKQIRKQVPFWTTNMRFLLVVFLSGFGVGWVEHSTAYRQALPVMVGLVALDPPYASGALQQNIDPPAAVTAAGKSLVRVVSLRGDAYDPPPTDDPGRLGRFPVSPREKEVRQQSPHLDPAHPSFVPD